MKFLASLTLLLSITTVAAGGEFTTSYWYGPPAKFTSLETYQRIKDANFNVVFPPAAIDPSLTREQNIAILDICQQLGMKAVVYDPRMPASIDGVVDAKAKIDAIVADYSKHPALLAYFIVDEPSASQFDGLGKVMAYLKERDSHHPGYINLFPMHANKETQLGTADYNEYVDRFVQTVDPFIISYDHYPFLRGRDQPEFIPNLAHIRNAALKSKRPFWNIVQCVQHYDYRQLTEPELRFMAMQTLAFGGKGLLWYTYWYPGQPNETVRHAMIKFDGTPDEPYEWIKQINADARAIGNELMACESFAVFQRGANMIYPMPEISPIVVEGGDLTVGVFKSTDGAYRALITNRDYRKAVKTRTRIVPPTAAVQQFDPATKTWRPAAVDAAVEIPAGGGVLLRW